MNHFISPHSSQQEWAKEQEPINTTAIDYYILYNLLNSINKGEIPSQIVRFVAYEFLVSINHQTGGKVYRISRKALESVQDISLGVSSNNLKNG